jgi:predicted DNA binding CopG/RHH family protein
VILLFVVDGVVKASTTDHMKNDAFLTLRITEELRDKLKAAAIEVNMPLSVFLRIMLSRIVKNQKTNKPI